MKFFCDEQLGKLSRRLRTIGWDAAYEREIDDADLIERARAEGRVVLTRDHRLPEMEADVEIVLLTENYPAHQLREVVEMFGKHLKIEVFSRCVACNGEKEPVSKQDVEGLTPSYVFQTQEEFTRSRDCGKFYWRATHRDRVELQLRDVLGDLYRPEVGD